MIGFSVSIQPFHVLIVEDDEVTRAKLSGYMEAAGYRVSEAEDGQAMWQILTEDPADLLFLDINLPGEDGLELTRQLRSKSDIGIVLVTGRTDDVDRIVGLEIGADDYITKPFNPARTPGTRKEPAAPDCPRPPFRSTTPRFSLAGLSTRARGV